MNNITLPSNTTMLGQTKIFLREICQARKTRTLHRRCGEFLKWFGTHYEKLSDEKIKVMLYTFFEEVQVAIPTKKGGTTVVNYSPNAGKISALLDALKASSSLSDRTGIPCWLDDRRGPSPADMVSFVNGLLHVPTRQLIDHTPMFLNMNSLPFEYNPDAPCPVHWLKFLDELWPDDPGSINLVQEWFGNAITADTTHHKILMLIGPPRSGKGTLVRVLTAMLGQHNCCGPTLGSLKDPFGLEPFIGKLLATVSDARLAGGAADQGVVVERLLSVSGEDSISVNRKNQVAWEGKLNTRLMIVSNELPRLADSSSALVTRLLLLRQTQSWLGKEDRNLTARLLKEMPGIIRWSLDGLDRLVERGHFVQPESGDILIRQMYDLASPISAFVRDECQTDPSAWVGKAALYSAWVSYCAGAGMNAGTSNDSARKLRAALPLLGEGKRGPRGEQVEAYTGLTLADPEWINLFTFEEAPQV